MINSCFLSLFLITLLIYLITTDNFFKAMMLWRILLYWEINDNFRPLWWKRTAEDKYLPMANRLTEFSKSRTKNTLLDSHEIIENKYLPDDYSSC